MSPKSRWFWLVFSISLALDQATKLWIYFNLAEGPRGDVIPVIPGFFDLVHAENPGAAFSLFATFEYRYVFFLVISVIAGWIVWDQYRRLLPVDRLASVALALIGSGAAGNAIDRVWKRTVTDFVRLYIDAPGPKRWLVETFGTNEYPSWNVADAALLIGVVLFVIAGGERPAPAKAPSVPAEPAAPAS